MESSLLELAADIVIAHASTTEMTSDELINEIKMVHATLKVLEQGESEETPAKPAMTLKQAFKKDQIPTIHRGLQYGFTSSV